MGRLLLDKQAQACHNQTLPKEQGQRQWVAQRPTTYTEVLCKSPELQAAFSELVSGKIPTDPPGQSSWDEFSEVLCSIATEMLGARQGVRKKTTVKSGLVLAMWQKLHKQALKENAAKMSRQKAVATPNTQDMIALVKR